MDKTRDDYAQARDLLRRKVEPARKRLLAHYKRKAVLAERKHVWARALDMYEQAASFSLDDKAFWKKVRRMDLRMRQVRLDKLIKLRRSEDSAMLAWLDAYAAPRELAADDAPFIRKQEQRQDWLEDWIDETYREARRYLSRGYPEVAYVEIESHLRLDPGSSKGLKLKKKIISALPTGLKLPRVGKFKSPESSLRVSRLASAEQIRLFIKQGKLLRAKKSAVYYRRHGGKDAELLLKRIQARIEKQADAAFQKGRVAFREERLPEAAKYWRRAAELMPEQADYAESLRRAEQLQERLRILRGSK